MYLWQVRSLLPHLQANGAVALGTGSADPGWKTLKEGLLPFSPLSVDRTCGICGISILYLLKGDYDLSLVAF